MRTNPDRKSRNVEATKPRAHANTVLEVCGRMRHSLYIQACPLLKSLLLNYADMRGPSESSCSCGRDGSLDCYCSSFERQFFHLVASCVAGSYAPICHAHVHSSGCLCRRNASLERAVPGCFVRGQCQQLPRNDSQKCRQSETTIHEHACLTFRSISRIELGPVHAQSFMRQESRKDPTG
jgi:hypothetical protein